MTDAAAELVDKKDVPSLLQTIPEELRSRFQNEVTVGDVSKLREVIADISSIHPGLGNFFQTLANDFAYDEIDKYLESDKQNDSGTET